MKKERKNGLLWSRKFIGVIGAIAGGLFAVHEGRGVGAYLPVVGPPPLRFQAVITNHFVFNPESFEAAEEAADTSNMAAQLAAPATNAANIKAVSTPIFVSSAKTNQISAATDEKNNSEAPVISPISSSSASDLLVTPQMITGYLQPAQKANGWANRRNQSDPALFVPFEMQVAPPTTSDSTKSQAIYNNYNTVSPAPTTPAPAARGESQAIYNNYNTK